MAEEKTNNFYQLKVSEALEKLGSSRNGLSEEEAKKRLAKYGLNKLKEEKKVSKFKILLAQFNNILIYIILMAAALSLFLRHFTDAIFILAVVLINIIVGYIQEYKAENMLKELKKLTTNTAAVMRGGQIKQINSQLVAIGDIVTLKPGDVIPADGRIIFHDNFKVDESSLTGELHPVEKNKEIIKKEAICADQINMIFAGTSVAEGTAKAVITQTGENTQFGKIVSLTGEVEKDKTPLQKKITKLSFIAGYIILSLIGVIFIIGLISGHDFYEIFVSAIALAVSVIPEGLLPAITIILIIGMRRILKKKALVKRLSSTETLGGVTSICLDKTGTLTEGKMMVSHIIGKAKSKILQIAAFIGEAYIENPEEELSKWILRGRPTDKALLEAAIESGISLSETRKNFKEISSLLFDSKIKHALKLFFDKEKEEYILFAMGAPEVLLGKTGNIQMAGMYQALNPKKIEEISKEINEYAGKGLRVIACGQRNLGKKLPEKNIEELFNDVSFLGMIALKDPLRNDAAYTMRIAQKAGIKPIIVTGDHALTARAVAEEAGYPIGKGEAIEGAELDKMSDKILSEVISKIKLFARVTPEHKLRIIRALKNKGEVVAMTGDGVNDAPALKQADIGLALGSGTDVAKEAADIILLDDNFKVIIDAVEEGRTIFNNIRKVLIYLIADDSSELFLFLIALIFGLPLPLLPAQILWINVVEDGFPDVALTMEKREKGIMLDLPRDPKEPILNSDLKKWAISVAAISTLAALAVFLIFLKISGDIGKTRTVVFALMSLDSLFFAYSVRSFKKNFLNKDVLENKYLNGSVLIGFAFLLSALYVPFLQKFIQTMPLGLYEWIGILIIAFAEIMVIEKMKIRILNFK